MFRRLCASIVMVLLVMGALAIPAFADATANTASLSAARGTALSVEGSKTSIAKCKITVASQLYTGKAISPKLKVTLGKKKLVEGRDYKRSFKNNVQPGKATVILKGINAYKGQSKATFLIKTKKGVMKIGSKAFYFKDTKGTKATGWIKGGSKWYWGNTKGKLVAGWKKISGTWYFFDKSKYYMQTGWKSISDKWYYFDDNGAMAANSWVGDYYLQADGSMATSKWIGDYWVDSSGKWTKTRSSSGSSGGTVYVTTSGNGSKYHRSGCSTISRSSVRALSVSEAISQGYTACKVCKP